MSEITMFMPLLMSCALFFIMLNHPLSCGLMLLLQTILISLLTGMMNLTFWYSYILFLIMIGGLLILFIYMTSIAANEKFMFNYYYYFIILNTIIISFILFFTDNFYLNSFTEIMTLKNFNNYLLMNKYFTFPMNMIIILMIIYLFYTLIAIVKITMFSYSPMRKNI